MKKNGFTLVELLAIIAVLTAIMLLVLPKFSSSVNDRKQKEYNKLIKTIENAGKVYHTYNQEKNKVSVNELVKEDLLTSGIKSPIDDTLISGCVFFGKDEKGLNTYTYQKYCNNEGEVILKVDLDGGTLVDDFSGGYNPQTIITLSNPTKKDYSFIKWELIEGNSTLNGNTLIMGTTSTTIKAIYNAGNSIITFDAQGGTVDIVSKVIEVGNPYGELPVPIKTRAKFIGWFTSKEGGTQIKEDTIVIENGSRTVYAHWEESKLTFELLSNNYSCNNVTIGNPLFIYTGECEVLDDKNSNWRIKFKTSGTLTFKVNAIVDAFLVGGGGSGGGWIGTTQTLTGSSGGGGGYTKTSSNFSIKADVDNVITIGKGGTSISCTSCNGNTGGTTSAFGYSAAGGKGGNGSSFPQSGGDGGSGGGAAYECGATDGNSYSKSGIRTSVGQGTTTREFGESSGDLYASGGGASDSPNCGIAGNGGKSGVPATSAKANTGSGGGGAWWETSNRTSGAGGSGIVVIRNTR